MRLTVKKECPTGNPSLKIYTWEIYKKFKKLYGQSQQQAGPRIYDTAGGKVGTNFK